MYRASAKVAKNVCTICIVNISHVYRTIFPAILALIQAIAPELANNSGGHLTSDEVANRLTDKLAEIVGQENTGDEKRNERGEVCSASGMAISNNLDCP